jgi:ribokinase
MQRPIVVVGSLNLDLVARINRHPAIGETITGVGFNTYCGGKGANQAVALARLSAPVKMIGKLGSDAFAAQLRQGIESAGVDASCVESVPGASGTALILSSTNGDNSIVVIPGANAMLLPEDIERHRQQIEGACMVLGQLEIPNQTTECLGRLVRSAGIPFLLDPSPAYQLSPEVLQSVTWLTPNETEARCLLGIGPEGLSAISVQESAERLLDLGVRNVILKRGNKGVYMVGKDVEPAFIDTVAVQAVDTTAAGDAFNGAFAFAFAHKGMAPREAAEFACAAAALSVTRAGAQTSMPTIAECEAFMALRKQMPALG